VPGSIGYPQCAPRHIGGSIATTIRTPTSGSLFGMGRTIITNKRRIARRFLHRHVLDRAGRRRDHRQGELPDRKKSGLREVQASGLGFALVGVFVSKRGSTSASR